MEESDTQACNRLLIMRNLVQAGVPPVTQKMRSVRNVARCVLLGMVLLVTSCFKCEGHVEIRQDASQPVPGPQEVAWTNVVDQLHDLGIEVDVPDVLDSKVQFKYQDISMDLKVERGITSLNGARSSVIHMTSDGGRKQMESLLETLVQYHRKTWNGSNQGK